MTVKNDIPPATNRGGHRGTTAVARFTAQLVALVLPDRRQRVLDVAKRHQVSQAAVMRRVVDEGLPLVEQGLASGTLSPDTLV